MYKIIASRSLKIWTILTHAFIIIGIGHGIGFFALIEIVTFPYVTNEYFNFSFNDSVENHLAVSGFLTLLGQIALLFSIFNKNKKLKDGFQIGGLILFWLTIVYFIHDASKGTNIHLSGISCIPFVICTVITFLGQPIKRLYQQRTSRGKSSR